MARGAAKSAELRRIAASDEPLVFGSLYRATLPRPTFPPDRVIRECRKPLPQTDSTVSAAASGTALSRWARSFMQSIRAWFR